MRAPHCNESGDDDSRRWSRIGFPRPDRLLVMPAEAGGRTRSLDRIGPRFWSHSQRGGTAQYSPGGNRSNHLPSSPASGGAVNSVQTMGRTHQPPRLSRPEARFDRGGRATVINCMSRSEAMAGVDEGVSIKSKYVGSWRSCGTMRRSTLVWSDGAFRGRGMDGGGRRGGQARFSLPVQLSGGVERVRGAVVVRR